MYSFSHSAYYTYNILFKVDLLPVKNNFKYLTSILNLLLNKYSK